MSIFNLQSASNECDLKIEYNYVSGNHYGYHLTKFFVLVTVYRNKVKGNYEHPTKKIEQLVELADKCRRILLGLNK